MEGAPASSRANRLGRRPRLVACIPAHNEARSIETTIGSLWAQTLPPDQVVVAADNCSDDTPGIAAAADAQVLRTQGNQHKKAGALNQALARVLPGLADDDLVLVVDADTALAPRFVEVAVDALRTHDSLGAVGGVFQGHQPSTVLELAQANEYARYAEELERTGRVMVLTGTAAVIRVRALREVAGARGRGLPGVPGDVYHRTALTEDMELTLALKSLGWALRSPKECLTITELMPTAAALHRQRVRWYRGALDNLREYGWTPVTRRYWAQQVALLLGVVGAWLYLTVTAADLAMGRLSFSWFWTGVGLIFLADRLITVRRASRRGQLLAAAMLPELYYDLMLQLALLRAVRQHLRRTDAAWHHDTSTVRSPALRGV